MSNIQSGKLYVWRIFSCPAVQQSYNLRPDNKGVASVVNSLALIVSGVKTVASDRRANERIVAVDGTAM